MPPSKAEETYYDILKVDPKATIAEIVAAYHTAKNAFSRDSVATYSLFTPEEAQAELDKLEQAYLHLSNIDKKRAYDRALEEQAAGGELPPEPLAARDRRPGGSGHPESSVSALSFGAPVPPAAASPAPPPPRPAAPEVPVPAYEGPITGGALREIRTRRQLSIDDVSRITKIPVKFITALEQEDAKSLPARVYLQGFIKNLAALYKLDPKTTVRSYLDHVDGKTQEGSLPKG